MPDEIKATVAEKKSEVAAADKPDQVNDKVFDDPKGEGKEPVKQPQSKEENAVFAQQRREAEKAKAVKQAEFDAIVLATDGVNPYTQKPIKTALDADEFKTMKALQKAGKDPVADYHEAVKAERMKNEADENARTQSEEATKKDIQTFKAKHPDVDIPKLMQDKKFLTFSKHALGTNPLTEIYEDYLAVVGEPAKEKPKEDEKDLVKKAQALANAEASPGSLKSTQVVEGEFYTLDQIQKMTQAEEAKNHEKVMKSLRHLKIVK